MSDEIINTILKEIRGEQHISPYEDDEVLINYIKEAEFDINHSSGNEINYSEDLKAKSLLKNYVFYARHQRLAEFKQLYAGEYAELQAKYYPTTDIQ